MRPIFPCRTVLRQVFITLLLLFTLALTVTAAAASAANQASDAPQVCDDVRYLMAQNATPYDLSGEGGALPPGVTREVSFAAGIYSQFYAFRVVRPTDSFGNPLAATINVTLADVPDALNLEAAIFRGMERLLGFQPVANGTIALDVQRDAVYTLVLRRASLTPQAMNTAGALRLTLDYPGDAEIQPANLRDNSTGSSLPEAPRLRAGLTELNLGIALARVQTGSVISVASQGGLAAQLRFEGGSLLVGGWAQRIDVVAGDLAASGLTADGQPRLFYLQDYGYQRELFNENLNITDTFGTQISTDWQGIRGLWLLRDCIGVKLLDGRTFTAPTRASVRQVVFSGGLEAFNIRVTAPDAAGTLTTYEYVLDWRGVLPESEVRLLDGVLTMTFVRPPNGDPTAATDAATPPGTRLELAARLITMSRRAVDGSASETTPLDITLIDRGAALAFDFVSLASFTLTGDTIAMQFTDRRAELTPLVTRSAANLARVESLDSVIQIVYQDAPNGIQGEQRLILPESDGFVEIITPAGLPVYNSRALPDETGYFPRGLNNLGGECYPVNTTLTEANCPPNGEPNPANGNLWYSVVDLRAFGGYDLDLTLTRSYNSRAANVDGPFGFGWTTEYLLDYNVRYDPAQGTRPVTPGAVAAFRVGLDVTYAPRGLVTLTTFSGSRHVFASQNPNFSSGTLTALTMPGWTLNRPSIRANWVLRQSDGFTIEFDRAGRLVSYGYPEHDRKITVEYPSSTIEGAAGITAPSVRISDDFSARQLELYYDASDHIRRSVLRDTTQSDTFAACDPLLNCEEIRYTYTDGLLTTVRYNDGQTARYTYDTFRRLVGHDDPRAPVAPQMTYTYTGAHLEAILVRDPDAPADSEPLVWRRLSVPRFEQPQNQTPRRVVTVTDELNRQRTYRYASVETAGLREVGAAFTLLEVSSPLDTPGGANTGSDARPDTFTWTNGLLTQINARLTGDNVGRNSLIFRYTPTGGLQNVSGGVLDFDLSYGASGLPEVTRFADDTSLNITYDARGLPVRVVDRQGAIYGLAWDSAGRLLSRTRENDGKSWDYTHTRFGQIASVATGTHIVTYRYDAFGRLVTVDDLLLGTYDLSYGLPQTDANGALTTQTVLRNTAGVETQIIYDAQGRLIETRLVDPTDPERSLRRTTYRYDVLDRLTAETVYIEPLTDDAALTEATAAETIATPEPGSEPVEAEELATRYSYAPVATLTDPDGTTYTINGYSITVLDAYGRRDTYTYDALDRIRRVEDALRRVTRFEYSNTPALNPNGFRVTQQDWRGTQAYATTVYDFDLRGQLREVNRTAGEHSITWNIITEGDPVQPRFLEAVGADVVALTWTGFQGAAANDVQLRPVALPLESGTVQPTTRLGATYDFLGRPLQTVDGTGKVTRYAYCPLDTGGYEMRVSSPALPGAPAGIQLTDQATSSTDFGCAADASTAARRMVYDVHNRLVTAADGYGSRTFTYTRDLSTGGWLVDAAFGDNYTWHMQYNAAGDLTLWRDEDGIIHLYRHDSAGRLVRVSVPNEPEASFSFAYNAAGLLTRQVDDVGRGFLYQYDERGLLLVRQDAQTADAATFAYGPFGEMTSAISPLGYTTTFRYDDLADPSRLTGVTDPTGVLKTFTWSDADNSLIYADVRGNRTTYTFDALGLLWRVDDAAGQSHELHYDAAGNLTEVLTAQPALLTGGGDALRTLILTPLTDGEVTVTEASQPDWRWSFGFNASGALTRVTPPEGFPFTFDYDRLGRIRTATTGTYRWTLEREPGETRLRINDRELAYDSLYRLTRETMPDGSTITYTYDVGTRADTTLAITRGDESPRVYTFSPGDDSARPRTVTLTAPGQTLTYTYNAEGLIEEFRTDACIADEVDSCVAGEGTLWTTSIRFNYDTQGRPVRIVDQEQNVETFAYDDQGNLIAYQTPNGKTFNYTYDSLNRLIALTSPTGIKALLRYDALNNVTGVCRTRAEAPNDFAACEISGRIVETYAYDSLGRLVAQTFPNVGSPDGETSLLQTYTGSLLTSRTADNTDDLPVTRSYEANALGLLSLLRAGVSNFDFRYDGWLRLTQAGETLYSYDAYGRLAAQSDDAGTYQYSYLPDRRGYSLTSLETGTYVLYGLDERGFLAALDYGLATQPNDLPLLSIDYRLNPRQPDVLSVLMNSQNGTKTLDLQVNRRNETRNIVTRFDDQRLLADYITDPVGLVTRQRVDGAPDTLFAEGAGGYIIVTGYDDDNRPNTVRITDKSGGRLLYTLNFTYNDNGQRLTENRRHADNTQMNIRYEYGTPNQLTRRIVEIVPPASTSSLPGALLTILLFLWMAQHSPIHPEFATVPTGYRPRRSLRRTPRRQQYLRFPLVPLLMVVGGLLLSGMLLVSGVNAQRVTQVFTFDYRYDPAGNVSQVLTADPDTPGGSLVCREYFYDSGSRLTALRVNSGQDIVTYRINPYGQLTSIEGNAVRYAGHQPVVVRYRDGLLTYDGRLANRPPVWISLGADVIWQMPDGRDGVLAVDNNPLPVRLTDPLGRVIALNLPFEPDNPDLNPCVFSNNYPAAFDFPPAPQTEFNRLLAMDGYLYLDPDGRVYDPVIGRYLQRDPYGPNELGSVYDIGQPQPVPAQRRLVSTTGVGLVELRNALAITRAGAMLDAATVAEAYYPRSRQAQDWTQTLAIPGGTTGGTAAGGATAPLAALLTLPQALQGGYNLTGAQPDALTGAIQLETQLYPGQTGLGSGFEALSGGIWSGVNASLTPTSPGSPLTQLQALTAAREVPFSQPITSYQSRRWVPAFPVSLGAVWDDPAPDIGLNQTPGAVLDALPLPLRQPEAAFSLLAVVERLAALSDQTGQDWLDSLVYGALPTLPDLPPRDAATWRERWFTSDTLGLRQTLAKRLAVPPLPDVPVYGTGYNADWLFLNR